MRIRKERREVCRAHPRASHLLGSALGIPSFCGSTRGTFSLMTAIREWDARRGKTTISDGGRAAASSISVMARMGVRRGAHHFLNGMPCMESKHGKNIINF